MPKEDYCVICFQKAKYKCISTNEPLCKEHYETDIEIKKRDYTDYRIHKNRR